jgi:phosphohistidine swiveling domain-containing protein
VTEVGANYGFNENDLSFSNINTFLSMHSKLDDHKAQLTAQIRRGKTIFEKSQYLNLPPLIFDKSDIFGYEQFAFLPNFVTRKTIIGPTCLGKVGEHVDNCIVCIEAADPGFDWLFSKNIRGLITAWGGSNSHMAIRANELGLPAAIGVGEQLLDECLSASSIMLDAASQTIKVLQ